MGKVSWNNQVIFAATIIFLATGCKKEITPSDIEYPITHWPVVQALEATNIDSTIAKLNGTVDAYGLPTVVTFEYGTTASYGSTVTASESPVTQNGVTYVSADIAGLTPHMTYHYRIKAENSLWINFYSSDSSFISGHIPMVTTTAASNITTTSAISGGNITDDGGSPITDRGVYCSQSLPIHFFGSGKQPSSPHTHDGTGCGSFLSNLTTLQPSKTYYVRSYAINSSGMALGDLIYFTTLSSPPPCGQDPIAATLAATHISSTGATLNGTVNANGLSTTVTFEYGVYLVRTKAGSRWHWMEVTATQSPVTGTNLTNVSANVTGLGSGTSHPFKVKAENSCGTVYGAIISFTLK